MKKEQLQRANEIQKELQELRDTMAGLRYSNEQTKPVHVWTDEKLLTRLTKTEVKGIERQLAERYQKLEKEFEEL